MKLALIFLQRRCEDTEHRNFIVNCKNVLVKQLRGYGLQPR